MTGFRCRCGELFCSEHRYSDRHDCSSASSSHEPTTAAPPPPPTSPHRRSQRL
ncbi:Zinc finger A20 and AN1 domain-containing stress-associated protein 5 [Linum grandiflorum]